MANSYYKSKKQIISEIDEQIKKLVTQQIKEVDITELVFKAGSEGLGRLSVERRIETWMDKIPELKIDKTKKKLILVKE